MIQDSAQLAEARENWAGIVLMRKELDASAFAAPGAIPGLFPFALYKAAHNLPLVQAYAVLNDVLEQVAKEKNWKYQGRLLGRLLDEAKSVLAWVNAGLVETGKLARDDVAHHYQLAEAADC